MLNKIFIVFVSFFIFLSSSFANLGDKLYVTQNNTKVFFDLSGESKFDFYKGYVVKDLGDLNGNFLKVELTSGKEAYINKINLSNNIDSKFIYNFKTAKLIAKKFPLLQSPYIKSNVIGIFNEKSEFEVLHNILIDEKWVKVKSKKTGDIGYLWFKTLEFYDYNDLSYESNLKVNLNKIETSKKSDFYYQMKDLKDYDYEKYNLFLKKIHELKEFNLVEYNIKLNSLEKNAYFVYLDLINYGTLSNNFEIKGLSGFEGKTGSVNNGLSDFYPINSSDISEVENKNGFEIEGLDLNDLFK